MRLAINSSGRRIRASTSRSTGPDRDRWHYLQESWKSKGASELLCLTWRWPFTSVTLMNGRRLSSWLLVGVAVFVVLGHICASPIHAHVGAVTTHSEDHPESGRSEERRVGKECRSRWSP